MSNHEKIFQIFEENDLSWEALGLLAFLLAHPGEGFTVDELLSVPNQDREHIKRIIRQLVSAKRARFSNGQVFALEANQ